MKHLILTILFISVLSVNPFAQAQEATAAQLEESGEVLQNCYATLKLRRFYDCECYAAKFLDGRIKAGPKAQKEIILQTFRNDCRNISATTKYEYAQCIQGTKARPVRNIASEDFCQCYADQWANLFESYQGVINISSKSLLRLRARAYCKRPENYP